MTTHKFPTQPAKKRDDRSTTSILSPELLAAVEAAARAVFPTTKGFHRRSGGELGPVDDRLAFSIGDLSWVTGTGRQLVYDEINAGRLVAKKIGRRTVIRRDDIERWLASAPVVEPAATGSPKPLAMPEPGQPEGNADTRSPSTHENRPAKRVDHSNSSTPPATPCVVPGEKPIRARQNSQQNRNFSRLDPGSGSAAAEAQ
jgi:hypothetical protein